VEDILGLVESKGNVFNFIHVANAINKLVMKGPRSKDGREMEGKRLRLDPRFAQLIDLVRSRCHKFQERQIANVLHALGVFQADFDAVAVDERLAAQLGEIAEREASKMNPQGVANTYNALCKLEAVAATVSSSGWAGLAQAAGRTAREMNEQNVANTLNALCKLEAATAAVSPPGWASLAEAAERTAREMNPQHVANTLNAFTKLEAAAAAVTPPGWAGLAEAVERTAREMKSQDVANTLHALCKLDAAEAAVTPQGRRRRGGKAWRKRWRGRRAR
jgi:hypothetical protein